MQQAAATGYKFLILTNTLTEQTSNLCDQRWRRRRNRGSTRSHVRRIPPMKKRHLTPNNNRSIPLGQTAFTNSGNAHHHSLAHILKDNSAYTHTLTVDWSPVNLRYRNVYIPRSVPLSTTTTTTPAGKMTPCANRWEAMGTVTDQPPLDNVTDLTAASFVSDLCGASLCSTTKKNNNQKQTTPDRERERESVVLSGKTKQLCKQSTGFRLFNLMFFV